MATLRPRTFKQIPGSTYKTPKEMWGFQTSRQRGTPKQVARAVIAANQDRLGTTGLTLNARRHIRSLGADHIIFSQTVDGKPVHRAYVTVHMDRAGRAYLIKNRSTPSAFLPRTKKAFVLQSERVRARALRSVRGRNVEARVLEMRQCWFPRGKSLRAAYRVRIHRKTPKGRSEWIVFVDARLGTILSKYDNLAAATARALLFDPSPIVGVARWQSLAAASRSKARRALTPPPGAYQPVTLRGLTSSGQLDGPRVSTSLTAKRARIQGTFSLPSSSPHFEEVMAYYHVDEAARYVESLGYRGRLKIFTDVIKVNARGTSEDNSWYSPGLRTLTFGTGGVDDAEDGETIVHEFGHALQDAICPDFGQSAEAAAMGEGFGDYLAASLFERRKPADFRTLVMSWDFFEQSEEEPPRLRAVDELLTYESFDHRSSADEHDNGQIWAATLWDVRQCFRRAKDADRVIVESHFQLDGFTTFARGARAILDADRNLFRGQHVPRLMRVFRRRGIGPVE